MKKFLNIILISALCTIQSLAQNHYSYTWREFNNNLPKMECLGVMATATPDGSGHSRWSVGCETLDRDYAVFGNYKEYLGELGVGYARIQSGWAKTEQKKGKYDFKWLDSIVDGIIDEGVRPWMCLCYGNPLYGAGKGLGANIFTDENAVEGWKKYVEATVKRYKGKVSAYEIWNEPNLTTGNSPEIYADLIISTAEIIRKVDPSAKIIAMSLAGTWYEIVVGYTDQALAHIQKQGRLDLIDYITFHSYYSNPDESRGLITQLREKVQEYTPEIRLLQGEGGCPAHLEWGHALKYQHWSEHSKAKWDARRMACDFSMDIPSSIFTIIDLKYPNMQQSFGLLRANLHGEVIYKRPSWHAVQNMAAILTADTYVDETISADVETVKSVSVVGLKDKENRQLGVMLYFDGNPPTSDLEKEYCNVVIKGMSFKDPVYVEPITGKVLQLTIERGCEVGKSLKFYDFPIWDSPVFIMERNAVRLVGDTISVNGSNSNVSSQIL